MPVDKLMLPMRFWAAMIALLVLFGVGLVGFGLYVGTETTHSITVSQPIGENDLDSDIPIAEYDTLTPSLKDAFDEALQTGGPARVTELPASDVGYVHYRGEYYHLGGGVGGPSRATMYVSMMAGGVLVAAGLLGWWFSSRRFSGSSVLVQG